MSFARRTLVLLTALVLGLPGMSLGSNGYFLHGNGAVNESLGGAGTAGNTDDVVGSLFRNPASALLFDADTASVSLGAVFADVTVKSSVAALGLSGSDDSAVDVIPLANLGVVFHEKGAPTAWYLAVVGEAGLHLDMHRSMENPVFMPQNGDPDNPFGGLFGGFGSVETQMEVVRIPLGFAWEAGPGLCVGVSVAPSVARLKFAPAAFAAPDDADANGIPTYPLSVDHAVALGVGFQAGVRYRATESLGIGFTLTSPTWFQDFEWDVPDETGADRSVSHHMDRPLTVGLGAGLRLGPDTLVLADLSWINYGGTRGFDETGFDTDGSLRGLGWDDQWVISLGIQHALSSSLTLRAGYNYGTNPIDDTATFYNVGSPLHNTHHLSLGLSWRLGGGTTLDFGYTHAFESSQSGQWYGPDGQAVTGTEIESSLAYDQFTVGVTFPL